MCGIAGIWDNGMSFDTDSLYSISHKMSEALFHRGPDDNGIWNDTDVGLFLIHRRLAILDRSLEGRQPMKSSCGRYYLVFNGEIYNYMDLKQDLLHLGRNFRGNSDTEVMLEAISTWGLLKSLDLFSGMFAFALWDRKKRNLVLARDRIGEKPLYYGFAGSSFVFASELKAIRKHPKWKGQISREAISLFLKFDYVPAPYSIFANARKLTPGCILTLNTEILMSKNGLAALEPEPYWSAKDVAIKGIAKPFNGNDEEAKEILEKMLKNVIAKQMVSDVPVGAFLSGGIDSSLVVALMQSLKVKPIRTFTIGFQEKSHDESIFARSVAGHLGTNHTEICVTPDEMIRVITKLPEIYDEPFSDISQLPTLLLSQMARQHVTVSLSGDGGDELFFGYRRYRKAMWLQKRLEGIPLFAKRLFMAVFHTMPTVFIEGKLKYFLPKFLKEGNSGENANLTEKILSTLRADTPDKLYSRFISHWQDSDAAMNDDFEFIKAFNNKIDPFSNLDFHNCMMLHDQLNYLPDDILVKVDRATMSTSLENRIPLLDHQIFEYAWSLPFSLKYRNGQQKWLLREILYKYVPRDLIERPKMGFGMPLSSWLRAELRDWAESLLDENLLLRHGYLNPVPIRKKWKEHLSGVFNWQSHLWSILVFQFWLERNYSQ